MFKSWALKTVSLAALVLFGACSASKSSTSIESMEQIYARQGVPVAVRRIALEPFSVYLEYPASLQAHSEAAATASLAEVVRHIHAEVGEHVRRGQVIVQMSQDNPSYLQAKAALDNARDSYERFKTMYANSAISPQDFDTMKARYVQAQAAFKAIDDMINVKAPIDGYLTRLDARVSDNVYPGSPLFTVSNLGSIDAKLWVGASEIGQIKVGERAYVDGIGPRLDGTVTQVALVMDPRRSAFPVSVRFDNPSFQLSSGAVADVSIDVYHAQAIAVNRNELIREGKSYYAFVVNDGRAQRRELELGRQSELSFEVLGGLNVGDELVTKGAQELSDGAKVRVASQE